MIVVADYDARLIDLYDVDNPDGPDHDYFRLLARDLDARSVLDLGCGTGILTVTFARDGREVVGVDPSPAMLGVARKRPQPRSVRWLLGDSDSIPNARFDLAVMTGNVAQHIPDPEWQQTLNTLGQVVRPGGIVAFETRNPANRAWESWVAQEPTTRATAHGSLKEWMEGGETAPGTVTLAAHNIFENTGDHVVEPLVLTFRDRDTIEAQLLDAGFAVDGVWGDWHRTPFLANDAVLVFEARRR